MADGAEDIVSRRTRGLDRAFEILEFLRVKRTPLRPNEIAVALRAPRSSIYELINLLLRHGMLDYQGGHGRVFLGRKLYFLGTAYADQFDLMRESEDMLERLAQGTRETAQMRLLEGNKYTVAICAKATARSGFPPISASLCLSPGRHPAASWSHT